MLILDFFFIEKRKYKLIFIEDKYIIFNRFKQNHNQADSFMLIS